MLRRVAIKLLTVSQSTTHAYPHQLLLVPQCQKRMSSSLPDGKLSGKVAIVTASTNGIGYAIAQRLAQDGARVMVSSRKADNVEQAVQKLKAESLSVEGIVCHAGKSEDRKKLVDQTLESFGAIDILVSNVGINPVFGPILETSEEAWDKIFDLNVKSAFLLTKEVAPHIEKRGGGSIIYISSIVAFSPAPGLGAYGVSKTALLGLTKALTPELAGMDIRVNCVCPGIIKTAFSEALWKTDPSLTEFLQNQIPLGRFGESAEISGLVSFLASQDASYITGESFVVAGGAPSKL